MNYLLLQNKAFIIGYLEEYIFIIVNTLVILLNIVVLLRPKNNI